MEGQGCAAVYISSEASEETSERLRAPVFSVRGYDVAVCLLHASHGHDERHHLPRSLCVSYWSASTPEATRLRPCSFVVDVNLCRLVH